MLEVLFGVVDFILCGDKHICGHGSKIMAVGGINCVGRITGADITVGGVNYGWHVPDIRGAVNNTLVMVKGWGVMDGVPHV